MSRAKGGEYENQACLYLQKRGFVILERNVYSRFGEIDIIAKKEGVLHFIEVKGGEHFDPVYAITPQKMRKMICTIKHYFCSHPLDIPYSLDAIIIRGKSIEWIENMTL